MTTALELREAQLYRILAEIFGEDRLVLKARLGLVCGGRLPVLPSGPSRDYEEWVKRFRCLITIVNHEDKPCLVVEFLSDYRGDIDVEEIERERYLPTVLRSCNIHYMTLSHDDLDELLEPDREETFLYLVASKLGHEVFT